MVRAPFHFALVIQKKSIAGRLIETALWLENLPAVYYVGEDNDLLVGRPGAGSEGLENHQDRLTALGLELDRDYCELWPSLPEWIGFYVGRTGTPPTQNETGISVTFNKGLLVRKPRLSEIGVSRQAVLDVFGGAGPLDEDDDLMSFGPLGDETVLKEKCQALMSLGIDYGFDQVDLNAEFPDWITFRAILEDDPDLETR